MFKKKKTCLLSSSSFLIFIFPWVHSAVFGVVSLSLSRLTGVLANISQQDVSSFWQVVKTPLQAMSLKNIYWVSFFFFKLKTLNKFINVTI